MSVARDLKEKETRTWEKERKEIEKAPKESWDSNSKKELEDTINEHTNEKKMYSRKKNAKEQANFKEITFKSKKYL